MKPLFLLLFALFLSQFSYAQWQYSSDYSTAYLLNGNVGIGTNSPAFPLHVVGQIFAAGFRLGSSATDNVNGAPWYGSGSTNLTLPGGGGTAVQFAGYWGINFQTGSGQMVMLNNGNVGIGLSNPGDNLSVQDQMRVSTSNGHGGYYAYDAATGGNCIFSLTRQGNDLSFNAFDGIGFAVAARSGQTTNYNLFINTLGNVGIGTNSPSTLFHLNNPTGNAQITIQNGASSTSDFILKSGAQSYECGLNAWGVSGFNIADATLGLIRFSIQNNTGNVGIGTTNPGNYKLAVNGSIHSQSVQIDMNGWSDYVFNLNYHLLPLSQLKSYINENHHLPDVPSEEEVIRKGVDLGEMVKIQTKKIEELTLYLIEKDKKDQEQQQEINELKQKLNTILNKVNFTSMHNPRHLRQK